MNGERKPGENDFTKKLEGYLRTSLPERDGLVLSKTEKLRLSASHKIFLLRVDWKDGTGSVSEDLIVRMEPDRGVHQSYDIGRECEAIKKMYVNGVPVPRIYCLEEDSSVLGHPFVVMEKIEGERLLDVWMRHPEYRRQLQVDLASGLAKIHSVDWDTQGLSFLGEPGRVLGCVQDEVEKWEKVLDSAECGHYPVAAEVASWLRSNAPPARRTTVCHGDYSILNAHVDKGRVAAILDWEMVGLGDPIGDIAWICSMAASMRVPDWDEVRFIRDYEEMSGTKVNDESLRFWKIFAQFKTIAIMVSGTRAFIESDVPSMREMTNFYILTLAMQDFAAKSLGF